jgi:predicted RNA binding protein YcfA (HicA-like mRNA interferase family)
MAREALQHIARHPDGTSLRDLLAALRRAGWVLRRHGRSHDVCTLGSTQVYVPHHNDGIGIGTIRNITKDAIRADQED